MTKYIYSWCPLLQTSTSKEALREKGVLVSIAKLKHKNHHSLTSVASEEQGESKVLGVETQATWQHFIDAKFLIQISQFDNSNKTTFHQTASWFLLLLTAWKYINTPIQRLISGLMIIQKDYEFSLSHDIIFSDNDQGYVSSWGISIPQTGPTHQ